jgi:hypothetical protein
VDTESVLKWLAQGAQPSDTVRRMLAKSGVWAHWRAVQQGTAKLGEMTGRVQGSMERDREQKPSKKVVAKIQKDEEKAKADAAESAAKAAQAEAAAAKAVPAAASAEASEPEESGS